MIFDKKMVLESILDNTHLEYHPLMIFFVGMIYASIGVILSISMFPDQASLVLVFFTAIASNHFIYKLIEKEENKDIVFSKEFNILKNHGEAVVTLMMLFIGFFIAFTLWKMFLPANLSNKIFLTQLATINSLNASIQGKALTGKIFMSIFMNNAKVIVISILFSFLYGVGAIFILAWNASVGGTFIGNFVRQKMLTTNFFHAFLAGMVRYVPHGFLEMAAYFIAALGGSILSIAMIRKDFGSVHSNKIIYDFFCIVGISMLVLLVAAFIEVFITPTLVSIVI